MRQYGSMSIEKIMIIIYHNFRYCLMSYSLTNDSALRLKSMPKYFVLFRFFPFNFTFFWKRPPTSFLIFPVFSTFVVLLWVDKHLELNDHLAAALLCSNASKRVTKNFKLGCMKKVCCANWGKIIKNVGENVLVFFKYSEPYTITIVSDLFDVMQKV